MSRLEIVVRLVAVIFKTDADHQLVEGVVFVVPYRDRIVAVAVAHLAGKMIHQQRPLVGVAFIFELLSEKLFLLD